MKPDTLNTIVMARILFDNAHQSCMVDDKHVASAGLVMLQYAVELLLYACLIEKGTDEQRNLERLSFDELISELKKTGVRVAKSGTLKAMNKQRVIVKHYGQLAEPTTVRHYFDVSKTIVDDLLQQVVGKSLYQIVLYDIVKNDEVRECLSAAGKAIEAGNHFEQKTWGQPLTYDICCTYWTGIGSDHRGYNMKSAELFRNGQSKPEGLKESKE